MSILILFAAAAMPAPQNAEHLARTFDCRPGMVRMSLDHEVKGAAPGRPAPRAEQRPPRDQRRCFFTLASV